MHIFFLIMSKSSVNSKTEYKIMLVFENKFQIFLNAIIYCFK